MVESMYAEMLRDEAFMARVALLLHCFADEIESNRREPEWKISGHKIAWHRLWNRFTSLVSGDCARNSRFITYNGTYLIIGVPRKLVDQFNDSRGWFLQNLQPVDPRLMDVSFTAWRAE